MSRIRELRKEQERLCPSHWTELAGIVTFGLFFALALYLNMPEPVDCGVDRDAPTLEHGCEP